MKSMAFIVLLVISLCATSGSYASGDLDHEEVRELFDAGKIVAVEPLILDAKSRHSGRLLEIELEYERGLYLYEIEMLDTGGRVIEFYYDATTGAFIEESWDD